MKKLQYQYNIENYISRIPGMFFCEDSKVTADNVVVAPEYGCYGKYVYDIHLPKDIKFYDIETDNGGNYQYQYNVVDGQIFKTLRVSQTNAILNDDTTYSYRSLMAVYYKYKDFNFEKGSCNSNFISFISNGIGRLHIDDVLNEYNSNNSDKISFTDENDLVPQIIYVVLADSIQAEMANLAKACEIADQDVAMCCNCQRYKRMGGDNMMKLLSYIIKEKKQKLLQYYYQCAIINETDEQENKCNRIEWNVNLVSSEKDLGLVSVLIDTWNPSKNYWKGDIIVKDDDFYECIKDYDPEQGDFDDSFELHSNENKIDDNPINITATTSSRLKGLRLSKTYLDEMGNEVLPNSNEDWLFYYRIGVHNRKQVYDELFNIELIDKKSDRTEDNLMVYGDYLNSVTVKPYMNEIDFDYVINAHLIPETTVERIDEDNNKLYFYSNFVVDNNSIKDGSYFHDTYAYESNSDIENLIYSNEYINIRIYDKNDILDEQNNIMEIPYSRKCTVIECKELSIDNIVYYVGDIIKYKHTYYACTKYYNFTETTVESIDALLSGYFTKIDIKPYSDKITYKTGDMFRINDELHQYSEVDYDDNGNIINKEGSNFYKQNRVIYQGCSLLDIEPTLYIPTNNYNVGDYVIYENKLYKCKKTYNGEELKLEIIDTEYYFTEYGDIQALPENSEMYQPLICYKNSDSYYLSIPQYNIYYTLNEFLTGCIHNVKLKNGSDSNKTIYLNVNKKYEFSTERQIENKTILMYGENVNISSVLGSYTINVDGNDNKDFTTALLYKEDYLTGIHYQPKVQLNVNIDRGNAASFERHLKLAEVKSVQDIETYQNGGFFTIEST